GAAPLTPGPPRARAAGLRRGGGRRALADRLRGLAGQPAPDRAAGAAGRTGARGARAGARTLARAAHAGVVGAATSGPGRPARTRRRRHHPLAGDWPRAARARPPRPAASHARTALAGGDRRADAGRTHRGAAPPLGPAA